MRGFSQRVLAEGILDRGDAFVGGKQPLDVAARRRRVPASRASARGVLDK